MTEEIVNGKRPVGMFSHNPRVGLTREGTLPAVWVDSTKVKVWQIDTSQVEETHVPIPIEGCTPWLRINSGKSWVCVEFLPEDAWHGVTPE